MLGLIVTDCWKAYCWHLNKRHQHKNITIEPFSNLLAKDMLDNQLSDHTSEDEVLYIPKDEDKDEESSYQALQEIAPVQKSTNKPMKIEPGVKRITRSTSANKRHTEFKNLVEEHSVVELNEELENSKGDLGQVKQFRCKICSSKTRWHCMACKARLCENHSNKHNCVKKHAAMMASKK